MELDGSIHHHPRLPPQSIFDTEHQDIDARLKVLYQTRQRLLSDLQRDPYHQHEIECQLNAVNQDIQYYHQKQPLTPNTGSNPITPTTMENTGFPNQGPFMSPVDSAFVSGVTTKAPSVVGDMEDLDQLPEDFPPPTATIPHGHPSGPVQHRGPNPYSQYEHYQEQQAIANEQIMQTTGDRVRMTMFPDTIAEGEEVPSTQIMPDKQTNLQRMAQPAQVLRAAVQNLVNYQSNSELTAKVLPEIIALLSHQDQSVVLDAAKLLLDLSKKEASLQAINANPNAVLATIQSLASATNPEIQKALAGTVHNISSNSQGLVMIYKSSGIPYLVRMLTSQVDAVLFYAVTTIHNLLFHFEPAKMDVRLAGGLEKLVALLIKDNVKFLAIAADCLHILAYSHQDSKLIILASGGPAYLVRIMRIYTYEKLLWTVSRLLKVLSVCQSNKSEIVQAGGMQVLSLHIGHRSTRLVQNILFTLRNLSDAATKQDNLDDLLHHLINFLTSSDLNTVTCSAGVLSNLTCNNAKNKTIVCQLHGVEALLRAINNNGDKVEVVERCVCSLRHITSRHPGAELAQNSVRELNGIPMLMNLLQPQTRWTLIKALIGLFRNLALNHDNHLALRDQGCIPKLWQLLNRSFHELQRRGQPGMAPGVVDGVSMNEVVECSTTALHLLARNQLNRIIMRQLNVIPTFVQLLKMRDENIQRAAVGALSELAVDPEGAEQIEREGASAPLTNLLHSTNEGIAAYAAAVLFCLSNDDKHLLPADIGYRTDMPYGMDGMGGAHSYYAGANPMFSRLPPLHYSNPGSHPGSQPFTPNMSEPPSGIMTPHSEFELPLDFDDLSRPGSGFHSHSGIHTPNHPHSHHSAVHTPGGHHSSVQTPNHHSGVHTPHSGMHTPNHYPMSHPSPMQPPPPQPMMAHQFPPQQQPAAMAPGYYRVQQGSYNPPSPALMDTNTNVWLDTDL